MRKKTVQVILTQNVHLLGKQGQLIKVKSGYIRNYLIPSKLGKLATPKLINQFKLRQQELTIKEKQSKEKYTKFKEILENLEKFRIKKKISENGKFFGKITKKQILDLISNKTGGTFELTKNQLELPEMKQVGDYTINIVLNTNIIAKINIKILPE
uniref:50S ribosomal protein L9, chloroplastic n=1 Tax=Protohalopteris sp. TaxID=2843287 RepID=A0A8F0F7F4_9PHAE|nr:ribosomal protein L9 [Protohalopteris sp.]